MRHSTYKYALIWMLSLAGSALPLTTEISAIGHADQDLVRASCSFVQSNFQPETKFEGCNAYRYQGLRTVWPYGNSPYLKLVWIQFAGSDAQGQFQGVATCLVDLSGGEPQVRQCDQKM